MPAELIGCGFRFRCFGIGGGGEGGRGGADGWEDRATSKTSSQISDGTHLGSNQPAIPLDAFFFQRILERGILVLLPFCSLRHRGSIRANPHKEILKSSFDPVKHKLKKHTQPPTPPHLLPSPFLPPSPLSQILEEISKFLKMFEDPWRFYGILGDSRRFFGILDILGDPWLSGFGILEDSWGFLMILDDS